MWRASALVVYPAYPTLLFVSSRLVQSHLCLHLIPGPHRALRADIQYSTYSDICYSPINYHSTDATRTRKRKYRRGGRMNLQSQSQSLTRLLEPLTTTPSGGFYTARLTPLVTEQHGTEQHGTAQHRIDSIVTSPMVGTVVQLQVFLSFFAPSLSIRMSREASCSIECYAMIKPIVASLCCFFLSILYYS